MKTKIHTPLELFFGSKKELIPTDWQNAALVCISQSPVTITSVLLTGPFESMPVSVPRVLSEGDVLIVPVRFTPIHEGLSTGSVSFTTDDPHSNTIIRLLGNVPYAVDDRLFSRLKKIVYTGDLAANNAVGPIIHNGVEHPPDYSPVFKPGSHELSLKIHKGSTGKFPVTLYQQNGRGVPVRLDSPQITAEYAVAPIGDSLGAVREIGTGSEVNDRVVNPVSDNVVNLNLDISKGSVRYRIKSFPETSERDSAFDIKLNVQVIDLLTTEIYSSSFETTLRYQENVFKDSIGGLVPSVMSVEVSNNRVSLEDDSVIQLGGSLVSYSFSPQFETVPPEAPIELTGTLDSYSLSLKIDISDTIGKLTPSIEEILIPLTNWATDEIKELQPNVLEVIKE